MSGEVQEKLHLEGLSDFSKLIEVLRAKYIPEKQFSSLKTNEEKVKFCLEKDEVRSSIESFIERCFTDKSAPSATKSTEECQKYRLEGNKYFRAKRYDEALRLYSKALLLAPFSDEFKDLSQAFANRSAALFQLNAFSQCVEDVDQAIKHGFQSDQLSTLVIRKALSLKALGKYEEAKSLLESIEVNGHSNNQVNGDGNEKETEGHDLDYKKSLESSFEAFNMKEEESSKTKFTDHLSNVKKPNSKLLSATDGVKVCHSPMKGCHLKATRNITRDEALIVEKPFASVLNISNYEQFCNYCFKELNKRLYPCKSCSDVSYCSQMCSEKAWEEYHSMECPFLDILHGTGVLRLSLRIAIVAGKDKIIEVERETKAQNLEKLKRGSDYKSLFYLSDHSNELSYLISSRQTLAGAFMLFVASNKMNIISRDDSNYYKFGGILLKHIHQISVNSIAVFHQPIIPGPDNTFGVDVKNQVIGTAIFPTVSLLNHSCITNTECFFKGNKIFLRSRKPIATGEEITYCYGPTFKKMTRTERMETLLNQYYFRCTCPACNDDLIENLDNLKTIHPVLTEAFLCESCHGPLLLNGRALGKCLKCGKETNDASKIMEQVEMSKKLLNVGKAFLQFGRTTETEKQYLKAIQLLQKVCWPINRLMLSMYHELLYCSIFLENLESAKKYCEEGNRIKKLSYGEESVEYIQGQLQILNIRWTQQKKIDSTNNSKTRTNSMNKKLVSKLYQESELTAKNAKESIFRTETSGGLLILDSPLVSCLKELVELEKHIKLYKS